MENNDQQWTNILDPLILKPNLEFLSLYIALYEKLEDTIMGKTKDFFVAPENNEDSYNENVISLFDPKKCPEINKNCKTLISSLIWLLNNDAISEKDIKLISDLKRMRNKLTHEMFHILPEGIPKEASSQFVEMIEVFNKIEKWWIIEIEIPISGEFSNIPEDELNVSSGNMIILQLILDIATNNSNKGYEELCKKLNIPIR